jgi:hypothetical protein
MGVIWRDQKTKSTELGETYPSRTLDVHVDLSAGLLQGWQSLNRAGASADQSNPLASEIGGVVPFSGVHDWAFEALHVRKGWVARLREKATAVEQNVAGVFEVFTRLEVGDFKMPKPIVIAPSSFVDLGIELSVVVHVALFG